jgi:hypothetical protein
MLSLLLAAVIATVHGRVMYDGSPLPGVEVSIGSAKAVTDSRGTYSLAVPPGASDIQFHLEGFYEDRQKVTLRPGKNSADEEVMRPIATTEDFVLAEPPCGSDVPSSVWGWPLCDDYTLDTTLETAAKRGDHSAIDLLERRYETAFTLREKRQIAGILLHRLPDDSKYWKSLIDLAEDAPRFIGDDEATQARLQAYCSEKGIVDPNDYVSAIDDALSIVSNDSRSRPLLRRLLESNVPELQVSAVLGFCQQRDESELDAIDAVIGKATQYQHDMAQCLVEYRSETADKIAFKYLLDSERADYIELKQRFEADSEATPPPSP